MSDEIEFTKMQGIGNDFVIVNGDSHPNTDWPPLAVEMCRRHTGIGADGLLVLLRSRSADVLMRMFNPDGTPDVCGNGMRCVARYVYDRSRPDGESRTALTIETRAGIRRAIPAPDSRGQRWTVEMGEPRFAPADVPIAAKSERVLDFPLRVGGRDVPITALSTGSTHSVILVSELPGDQEFLTVSPMIENHPLFPQRTSVMWTRFDGPHHAEMRIWERGAGETWGCGTGACAAAITGILHGIAATPVRVSSKGGELEVDWTSGEQAFLTGPAEYTYSGVWPL